MGPFAVGAMALMDPLARLAGSELAARGKKRILLSLLALGTWGSPVY